MQKQREKRDSKTGWGKVADWYHETVSEKGSFQRDLILPNLLRLMDVKPGQKILDLGCGEGLFSHRFARLGADVFGVDVAEELIVIARQNCHSREGGNPESKKMDSPVKPGNDRNRHDHCPEFHVASAESIPFVKNDSMDAVAIVLALQNIEHAQEALVECSRVLKPGGKLFIVLNHPAFRIPKYSDWEWEEVEHGKAQSAGKTLIQYRRVWRYISETREKIDMAPGDGSRVKPGMTAERYTISFHRPLQYFIKAIGKAGLAVVNMEEWVSNKKSEPGPRAAAENQARKEIPLFLCLVAEKRADVR